MNIISAQYQRNGVSGRGFYAAVVRNPFGGCPRAEFLVISPDAGNDHAADPRETCVLGLEDVRAGELTSKWRGDLLPLAVQLAIRERVRRQTDAFCTFDSGPILDLR